MQLQRITSYRILTERINSWFESTHAARCWFPTPVRETQQIPDDPILNIVLFGSFVSDLYQMHNWVFPHSIREIETRPVRFWVLGSATAKVCYEQLGFPAGTVGILPRYELFPILARPKPWTSRNPMTLVYSGNMSPTKNFDLCLRVVSMLQVQLKHSVNFACYGTFNSAQAKDDVYPNTVLLPGLVESYEDYVRILVSKLPWTTPPSFNGYVHPEKWLQDEMASPAYFNLSCYEMEDFGVSAAQAQAAGWPCLLSDWGGFQDVRGSNIAKVTPPGNLARVSRSMADGYAWRISQEISDVIGSGRGSRSRLGPDPWRVSARAAPLPSLMRMKDLIDIRDRFVKKHALESCSADASDGFRHLTLWDEKGRPRNSKFFQGYRATMAGESEGDVVVFRSGKRLNWASMEEVFPALEKAWAASGRFSGARIHFFERFSSEIPNAFLLLERARCIVLTDISPEMIKILRHDFKINTPLVIHTHGEFAEGSEAYFEIANLLTTRDVFICASSAEARSVKTTFPNARVHVIPYALDRIAPLKTSRPGGPRDLIYIGRLSEQKNLHELLVGLKMLERHFGKKPKLRILGLPDDLGTPACGVPSKGFYPDLLTTLAEKLGLSERVFWDGFISRSDLFTKVLDRRSIIVSPSLHISEDFGAAAFQALAAGNQTVLSAWGGHLDYGKAMPGQVRLIPVSASFAGPWLNPFGIADSLNRALESPVRNHSGSGLKHYDFEKIASRLAGVTPKQSVTRSKRKIRTSSLFERIAAQNKFVQGKLRPQRCFRGYDDVLMSPLFRSYGMPGKLPKFVSGLALPTVYPWVQISANAIVVDDPRRGVFTTEIRGDRVRPVQSIDGGEIFLSNEAVRWLLQNGFAFLSG